METIKSGPQQKQPEIEKEEVARPSGPVISAQERMDSETDDSKKGWPYYWIKRLEPEVDILPDEIRARLMRHKGNPSALASDSVFVNYIRKRVVAKRFELEKRRIMFGLKKEMRTIDEKKEVVPEKAENKRALFYNASSESLFVENEDGGRKEITLGDLIGDYSWGIKYRPDPSMDPRLWRRIRKTLALYETKEDIAHIYDDELALLHGVSLGVGHIPIDYLEAQMTRSDITEKVRENTVAGVLAEKMITEFLTRIQYNNPGLGMKIEKSNALEDTVLKYDFKIILKRRRGVALEAEGTSRDDFVRSKRNLGVQFTISKHIGTAGKKRGQISKARTELTKYEEYVKHRVDDIVVVQMPELRTFTDLYIRWLKEGKPSGGPEQYLTREQKLAIFKQATAGLIDLSEQELAGLKI